MFYNQYLKNMTLVIVLIHRRMSAVAYLASYLSRAKFLSAALVTTIIQRFGKILNVICLFLTKYLHHVVEEVNCYKLTLLSVFGISAWLISVMLIASYVILI